MRLWLAYPAGNHGWLLRGDESVPTTTKRFESRESADLAVRPLLYVTWRAATQPAAETFPP